MLGNGPDSIPTPEEFDLHDELVHRSMDSERGEDDPSATQPAPPPGYEGSQDLIPNTDPNHVLATKDLGSVAAGETPIDDNAEQAHSDTSANDGDDPGVDSEVDENQKGNQRIWELKAKERDKYRPLIDKITGDNKTPWKDIAHEEANWIDDKVNTLTDPANSRPAKTNIEAVEQAKRYYRSPFERQTKYGIKREEGQRHKVEKATRKDLEEAIEAIKGGEIRKAAELYDRAKNKETWDFRGRGRFFKEKLEPAISVFLDQAFETNQPQRVQAISESTLFDIVDRHTVTVDEEKRKTPEMVEMLEEQAAATVEKMMSGEYEWGSQREMMRVLKHLTDLGILDAEGITNSTVVRRAAIEVAIKNGLNPERTQYYFRLPDTVWELEEVGLMSRAEYFADPRVKQAAKERALENIRSAGMDELVDMEEMGATTEADIQGWPETPEAVQEALDKLARTANDYTELYTESRNTGRNTRESLNGIKEKINRLLTALVRLSNFGILGPEQINSNTKLKEAISGLIEASHQIATAQKNTIIADTEQAVRDAQQKIEDNALNLAALQQSASEMGLIEKPEEDELLGDASSLPQPRQTV